MTVPKWIHTLLLEIISTFRNAASISIHLFKVMVPVIIFVKILQVFNLIDYLAIPLKPIMYTVGLPAEMGLVWATAIIDTPYSAIIVFMSIFDQMPINTAQLTILATMIMIAHNLPVELKVVQKAGLRLPFQAVLRLGSALLVGATLNIFYSFFDVLQNEPTILLAWNALESDQSLSQWAVSKTLMLLNIFLIIFLLMLLMSLLKKIGVVNIIKRILTPLMRVIGTSDKAATVTVIGLCLGINYGSGLILSETKAGELSKQDIFGSLSLMGINHAIIEDTILMKMLGADLSGILFLKLILTILLVATLINAVKRLPYRVKEAYLWYS